MDGGYLMSSPCENCGADLQTCITCDLYNGKYIQITEYATNGDMIEAAFPELEFSVTDGKSLCSQQRRRVLTDVLFMEMVEHAL